MCGWLSFGMSRKHGEKAACEVLEKIWSILVKMVSDMRKRKVDIPNQVNVALEGARIMINLCKHHPKLESIITPQTLDSVQGFCVACCGQDVIARIECELRTTEDILMIRAFNNLGEEYAEKWQKRLMKYWEKIGKTLQKK